jgi:hypothetical protein
MVVVVVEFSREGYKIRQNFCQKNNILKMLYFMNIHSGELSKIGHYFIKESFSKIEVIKRPPLQQCASKLTFLNNNKIKNESFDF